MKQVFELSKCNRVLSIFVTSLIVFLSCNGFASASFTVDYIGGLDGINGVCSSGDTVYIYVTSSHSDIRTTADPNYPFSCYRQPDYSYKCSYEEICGFIGGLRSHSIFEYYGSSVSPAQTVEYLIDQIAPTISQMDIITNSTSANVSYQIADSAYDSGTACAGIKRVSFYLDGTLIETDNGAVTNCSKSGSFSFNISSNHVLTVEAVDYVGNIMKHSYTIQ